MSRQDVFIGHSAMQRPHMLQRSGCMIMAFLRNPATSSVMILTGQAATQRPHPLQLPSIVTLLSVVAPLTFSAVRLVAPVSLRPLTVGDVASTALPDPVVLEI